AATCVQSDREGSSKRASRAVPGWERLHRCTRPTCTATLEFFAHVQCPQTAQDFKDESRRRRRGGGAGGWSEPLLRISHSHFSCRCSDRCHRTLRREHIGSRALARRHGGFTRSQHRRRGSITNGFPTLSVRGWKAGMRSDRNGAVQLAKSTGAKYAIYGYMLPTQGDSVHMHYGIADAAIDSVLVEDDAVGPTVEDAANRLTIAVLRELGKRHR